MYRLKVKQLSYFHSKILFVGVFTLFCLLDRAELGGNKMFQSLRSFCQMAGSFICYESGSGCIVWIYTC